MPPRKIALGEAGGRIAKPWTPAVIGDVNDCQIKLARMAGSFDWHHHDDEDEAFLVVAGRIAIDFYDGSVDLSEGDLVVVPHGVEHRPRAITDAALVLMFEPNTTLNTGTVVSHRTVAQLEKL